MTSLPEGIHFLQRGWLNCNQILLTGGEGPVLIDTGHVAAVEDTVDVLAQQGLAPTDLKLIINTHAHIDHFGGNLHLRSLTDTPLACGPMTAKFFAEDDRRAMWTDNVMVNHFWPMMKQPPVLADIVLQPGERVQLGQYEFEILATPGHAPDMICFYQPENRLLLCSDTMMEGDCGVMNTRIWPDSVEKAIETLETLSTLDIDIALPGHGGPITNVQENIQRVISILQGFQKRPDLQYRHILARSFMFLLLALQPVSREKAIELFSQFGGTPFYSEQLGLTAEVMSEKLLEGFERRGTVKEENGSIHVTVAV